MTTWKAAVALSRGRQLQTTTSKFSFFFYVLLGICIKVNHSILCLNSVVL